MGGRLKEANNLPHGLLSLLMYQHSRGHNDGKPTRPKFSELEPFFVDFCCFYMRICESRGGQEGNIKNISEKQ